MAKQPYQPPEQSMAGQVTDSLLLLALVIGALFLPLWLGLAGGGKTTLELPEQTWAGMAQTPAMQAQWEQLGYTEETAAELIASRFDYSFSWGALALTALVIIAYFGFVFRFSEQEYREVIDEKFGKP